MLSCFNCKKSFSPVCPTLWSEKTCYLVNVQVCNRDLDHKCCSPFLLQFCRLAVRVSSVHCPVPLQVAELREGASACRALERALACMCSAKQREMIRKTANERTVLPQMGDKVGPLCEHVATERASMPKASLSIFHARGCLCMLCPRALLMRVHVA